MANKKELAPVILGKRMLQLYKATRDDSEDGREANARERYE